MPMNPRLLRPLTAGFQALRVGLVAYWPLNETAASGDVTAEDWTKRGNDLTSNNSVLSTTGKVGNGRELVAANSEYLSRASNTDLQFGNGDWSIAAWVYPTATGTGEGFVVGKDQSGGREFLFSVITNTSTTSNKVAATIFHTDGTNVSVVGPSVNNADFLGKWYHAVVVHASGVVSLYLDGALASGSGSTPTVNRASGKTFAATATPFNVGRRSFSGFPNHLDAVVDELAKWNRALSATEISRLYNNGNGIDLRR